MHQINSIVTFSSIPTGIDPKDRMEFAVKAFPNPTTDYLILQAIGLVANMKTLKVSDITGRQIPLAYDKSDSDKLIFNVSICLQEFILLVYK